MVTKVQAARIATGAGVPVVLTAAAHAAQALAGADVGTYFHPERPAPGHPAALAGPRHHRARAGCSSTPVRWRRSSARRKSLLPAGVTAVEGDFAAGDPVDLCGPHGGSVARGLVNFDAAEIPELLGRSTRELAATLGPEYERELIHRDDIVILEPLTGA